MIHTQTFENNGKQYQRTWSDEFTLIQKPSNIEYYEATDLLPTRWTYVESEILKKDLNKDVEQTKTE